MAKTNEIPICLAEELILPLLDEGRGYLEMVPGWHFSCIMAGAVVADLVPESRIDTDPGAVFVADFRPTGDELLNPTLEEIVQSEKTFGTRDWTERNPSCSEEIVSGTLDRLVNRGLSNSVVPENYKLAFNPFPRSVSNKKLKLVPDGLPCRSFGTSQHAPRAP